MRLAEHVAHTVDVDGMLESMTPEQFDEWCAKDRVEPIGNEATRVVLGLLGCTFLKSWGCDDPQMQWFLPWVEKPKEQAMTWAQVMQTMGRK